MINREKIRIGCRFKYNPKRVPLNSLQDKNTNKEYTKHFLVFIHYQ